MNATLVTADSATHAKVVAIALAAAVLVVTLALAARSPAVPGFDAHSSAGLTAAAPVHPAGRSG